MPKPHAYPLAALVAAIAVAALYGQRTVAGASWEEQVFYLAIAFGLATFGLGWLFASPRDPNQPTSRMPRGVKRGLAAGMLTLGLMLFLGVALLPFIGLRGLWVFVGPWWPGMLILGSLVLIPFVDRRVQ